MAVEQNTKLQNQWLEAQIEVTRGYLFRRRRYFEASEQSYKKALDIFLSRGNEYHIAETYLWLGSIKLEIASEKLEKGIDKTNTKLREAEEALDKAELYLEKEKIDVDIQFRMIYAPIWRGVIARLNGELNLARDLFQSCIGKFPSPISVARLYRELALIEHKLGNKELAYFYEEKWLNLFRQLGSDYKLSPHNCYKVIDLMKREGTW